MRWKITCWVLLSASLLKPGAADAACCYFSAQNADILQPAQIVAAYCQRGTRRIQHVKLVDARRHHFAPAAGAAADVDTAAAVLRQEVPREDTKVSLENLTAFSRSDRLHGEAVPEIAERTYRFRVEIGHSLLFLVEYWMAGE